MKGFKRLPIWLVLLCFMCLSFAGCVPESDFQELQAEAEALRKENTRLKALAEEIEAKYEAIEDIQNELDNTIEELSSTKQDTSHHNAFALC